MSLCKIVAIIIAIQFVIVRNSDAMPNGNIQVHFIF